MNCEHWDGLEFWPFYGTAPAQAVYFQRVMHKTEMEDEKKGLKWKTR